MTVYDAGSPAETCQKTRYKHGAPVLTCAFMEPTRLVSAGLDCVVKVHDIFSGSGSFRFCPKCISKSFVLFKTRKKLALRCKTHASSLWPSMQTLKQVHRINYEINRDEFDSTTMHCQLVTVWKVLQRKWWELTKNQCESPSFAKKSVY